MQRYYFDYNATTPVDEKVLQKMLPYFSENYANPSALYFDAQIVRGAIESARDNVALLINADPSEIVFTSGGTEANNTVLKGVVQSLKDKGKHIITSQIEHPAILTPLKYLQINGVEVDFLPVDNNGLVNPEDVRRSIRNDTILISIMYVNNETGVIQPIEEISTIAQKHNIFFHTDAVQAVGKIPINVKQLGIDFLSLSGHKIYGPKGIGALYIKKDINILPLLHGGHHENYRRAGTENVPGIIGLGKACEIAKKDLLKNKIKITELRNKLESLLITSIPDININGHLEKRVSNTLNVSIKDVIAHDLLIMLDQDGFCLSAGSACSSGIPEPSHVLKAMTIQEDLLDCSIRISLGKYTTEKEIKLLAQSLQKNVQKARKTKKNTENP